MWFPEIDREPGGDEMKSEKRSLPMVALRGMTIMPEMVVHFDVSRQRSIAAIQEAMVEDQ